MKKEKLLLLERLPKKYVHINKFGCSAGRVLESKNLCDPRINYELLVKYEDVIKILNEN